MISMAQVHIPHEGTNGKLTFTTVASLHMNLHRRAVVLPKGKGTGRLAAGAQFLSTPLCCRLSLVVRLLPCWGKFPQLVPHHCLSDLDTFVSGAAVVYEENAAYEVREYHRAPALRLDDGRR